MAKQRTKISVGLMLIGLELVALPFALVARSRASISPVPPLRLTRYNMEEQPKYGPQAENLAFADRRAMRPHVPGTLAREDFVREDEAAQPGIFIPASQNVADDKIKDDTYQQAVEFGQVRGAGKGGKADWVKKIPIPVTDQLMHRGQERFNIYCSPCHGYSGYGNGLVNQTADQLRAAPPPDQPDAATKWAAAASYHQDRLRQEPDGELYNTIRNGRNSMAGYAAQISTIDRWAIVAYVRALQKSQNASAADIQGHEKEYDQPTPQQSASK